MLTGGFARIKHPTLPGSVVISLTELGRSKAENLEQAGDIPLDMIAAMKGI